MLVNEVTINSSHLLYRQRVFALIILTYNKILCINENEPSQLSSQY